jgi:hypothetical protein
MVPVNPSKKIARHHLKKQGVVMFAWNISYMAGVCRRIMTEASNVEIR